MGNSSSFMEKIYIYLPVIMFNSRMDYSDPTTLRTMRIVYFVEQAVLFLLTAYFIATIKHRDDKKEILVPDVSDSQVLMNTLPKPEELKYRRTDYFQHEMKEAFQQLQQAFVALMLTLGAHFIIGIRPILLFQIFSTPYNFVENRLFRKHVLGLAPGYRVWGERFESELEPEQIVGTGDGVEAAVVDVMGDAKRKTASAAPTAAGGRDESSPAVVAAKKVVQPSEGAHVNTVATPSGSDGLLMPKTLENALIDAWDAGRTADWSSLARELGPFTVNTQTLTGKWTPLMVACGLPQVQPNEIKTLVVDLDASVEMQDEDGWTCAHWAAQQGCAGALRAVLEGLKELSSDAEAARKLAAQLLSIRDKDGKTAAQVALDAGHEETVRRELMAVLKGAGEGEAEGGGMSALD